VLISDKKVDEARAELTEQINRFRLDKNYDTLVRFTKFVGSFTLAGGDKKMAVHKAETFVAELEALNDPYITKEAYLELAWIYNDAGDPKKAYEIVERSLTEARKISDPVKADFADIEYELGYYASGIGDYLNSKKHYQKALSHLQKAKKQNYLLMQQTYNALGGVMWYTSKMDSASYYFKKSLATLKKLDTADLMNAYYRPALVNLNIAVISNALGRNEEAISFSENAVKDFQKYIEKSKDEQRILHAKKTQLLTIDNLGSFHNAIGEFNKAEQLILYSYNKKKALLEPNDPNIIISLVILGQAEMSLQDFTKAGDYLDQAINLIKENPSVQLYWKAAAYISRADVYKETGNIKKAEELFTQGEEIYKKALGSEYSTDFMEDLIVMSQFYSLNGKAKKAISLAEKTFKFTSEGEFQNTLIAFKHTLNLGQVFYNIMDYDNALTYADAALNLDIKGNKGGQSISDSISTQFNKPAALLLQSKASYEITKSRTEAFLLSLMEKIDDGIAILEQRRTIITSSEDLSLLISQNNELFDFAKKLRLELYQQTGDETYLNDALGLHESSIYNRIRSRLNLRNNVKFRNVPERVIEREQKLRGQLSSALTGGDTIQINTYFDLSEHWKTFQDSLKKDYPAYYKLRYATLAEPLVEALTSVPEYTTVVRYFFVESQLYAYVLTRDEKNLFILDFDSVKGHIPQLTGENFDPEFYGPLLFELYNTLWKPFDDKISTEKVIIIPDRELFNLSFETLTPEKISSFNEFAGNSLLAKYSISYNFSALILDSPPTEKDFGKNFVAFAPEFSEDMKTAYQMAVKDSLDLDKSYLTLLPQPFSADLVKEYTGVLNGTSFLNEKASKQLFINSANEFKIIHIGTHAESNNVSPELSRLIFAKNISEVDKLNDNSLYTYEIYNYDLSSDLAILTACETGKPTYQAGEGMISLAHAFTYAGSESILTSLWKIDEKSSTEIIGHFYKNLKDGMPKDKALREAKLRYLAMAEGRTLAPQYWAGLVLMGDASPVQLHEKFLLWPWLIGGLIALILVFVFFRKRNS
jgi:CHAT domain-containing protein/tetratricopeptide (TPR) repeat protein